MAQQSKWSELNKKVLFEQGFLFPLRLPNPLKFLKTIYDDILDFQDP